jgi:hypothetical protein
MKLSRKKKELRVFKLKPTASFKQTAFAQNDRLLAAQERIHHHRPFFESRSHYGRLTHARARVEPPSKGREAPCPISDNTCRGCLCQVLGQFQ